MIEEICRNMCLICKSLKVKFYLNEKFLSYEEVFCPDGMLPAIAKRADQLASLCLGYGIGMTCEDVDKSECQLGFKVIFDDVTPNVLRYMCMTDVVTELMKAAPTREKTVLDELLYD